VIFFTKSGRRRAKRAKKRGIHAYLAGIQDEFIERIRTSGIEGGQESFS
jgi:hypothetical protein